jgi:SAM-dependent methyltransferase
MDDWYLHWFDSDYLALYAHRDEAEAERAVAMAMKAAPVLASGPVLDLACGTGRHLKAMLARNPSAFGMDLSAVLLAAASHDLRGRLLRGDMRRIPVKKETLAGITLWFTPFGYFGDAENHALLRQLSHLLRSGGVLLLDYLNAIHVRQNLVPQEWTEFDGLNVHILREIQGHRLVKRMALERRGSEAHREVVESLRLYEPDQLRSMACAYGLHFQQEMGDYDGSPFQSLDSPRWIGLFSKA